MFVFLGPKQSAAAEQLIPTCHCLWKGGERRKRTRSKLDNFTEFSKVQNRNREDGIYTEVKIIFGSKYTDNGV